MRYSIHADSWTETLAGLLYLIEHIDTLAVQGDKVNHAHLTRLGIISSSFLAEQVFAQASKQYIDEALSHESADDTSQLGRRILSQWARKNTLQKIGIRRALEDWPIMLVGQSLPLGVEPLQSLGLLMNKRNSILHMLSDQTDYDFASDVVRSALCTAVEASKAIWAHFFPSKNFPYEDWLLEYPVPSACYFAKLEI